MARTKKTKGIVFTDQLKLNPLHVGLRYRFRVLDPHHQAYRSKSFSDFAVGELWARGELIKLQAGLTTAVPADFAELGKIYVDRLRNRGRSERHIQQSQQIFNFLAASGIRDLRQDGIADRLEAVLGTLRKSPKGGLMRSAGGRRLTTAGRGPNKPASAAMKNRYLTMAKAVSRLAVVRRAIPYDAFAAVDPWPESQEQRRVFSVEELGKLVRPEMAGDPWFLYVALLIYTGARTSEVRNMTWQMVNLVFGIVDLPASLDGKPLTGNKLRIGRQIPLQPELIFLLKNAQKVGTARIVDEQVTKVTDSSVSRAFMDYCKRAGVEANGRGPHCVRHTFCCMMSAMDVSPLVIMSIVGHEAVQTTKHYSKRVQELRPQVKSWPIRGEFFLRRDIKKAQTVDLASLSPEIAQQIAALLRSQAG